MHGAARGLPADARLPFLVHPARPDAGPRQHEDDQVRGLETFLNLLGDGIARENLPGIEPDVDALGLQILGQARGEFLVAAAVGEKDPGHPFLRIWGPILGQV